MKSRVSFQDYIEPTKITKKIEDEYHLIDQAIEYFEKTRFPLDSVSLVGNWNYPGVEPRLLSVTLILTVKIKDKSYISYLEIMYEALDVIGSLPNNLIANFRRIENMLIEREAQLEN